MQTIDYERDCEIIKMLAQEDGWHCSIEEASDLWNGFSLSKDSSWINVTLCSKVCILRVIREYFK